MVPEDDADRRRQRYRQAVEILRDPRLVKDDTYAEKLATETAQESVLKLFDDVFFLM